MSNTNSSFLNIVKGVLLTLAGVVGVLLLQHYVFSLKSEEQISKQDTDNRIKPIAKVVITPLPKQAVPAATPPSINEQANTDSQTTSQSIKPASMVSNKDIELGKKTFESICTGCHSTGALGAPKYANKQDWAPRIAQGIDVLYKSAINGKNSMPAKGGNPALSDGEIKAAVNYMVTAVK